MKAKHSSIGASSCHRWLACPGSVSLSDTLPYEPTTSKYALEGTYGHSLVESILRKKYHGVDGEAPVPDGLTVTDALYDDLLSAAKQCVEEIDRDVRQTMKEYPYFNPKDPYFLDFEHKFHLKKVDDNAYGTNDVYLYVPFKKLVIYDFKFGTGVRVSAEDNPQLMYYALGAYQTRSDVEEIILVILQPRIGQQEDWIQSYSITPEQLHEFRDKLIKGIKATKSKNPTFEKGDHCKFCPAKAICPLQKTDVFDVVEKQSTVLSPSDITPEDIGTILPKFSLVRDWMDAVEKHALALAETGIAIPGHKLTEKYGNRAWVNPEAVVEEYEPTYGDKIYKKTLLSPAQMEKLAGKENVPDGLYEKPFRGHTLSVDTSEKKEVEGLFNEIT